MLTAVIQVVDYDPAWPSLFAQIRDRVWPHVSDVAVTIEHVGSTAVPGLAAKPIIEVDVVIPQKAKLTGVIGRLARIGYEHRGDLGIQDREAFKSPLGTFAHHLYVCRRGSVALRNHLTLRDHLRQHPEDAAAYAALKRTLAAACADVDEYSRMKTDFIVEILGRYSFSAEELVLIRRPNE
jgi:GrpB-like predicted nucleotidyltransferase (UPF0157 family)